MRLLNLNLDFRFFKRHFRAALDLKIRLRILKKKIYQFQPEFVTFQEVSDHFGLLLLKRIFKGYRGIYHGSLKIMGGVVTFYDPVKWKVVFKNFTAFSDQGKFFSPQLVDRILRKGILTTVFENVKTGKKLLLINLHLTANYGQKLADEERKILKVQLVQIKKLLNNFKKDCFLKIITGDFNANFSQTLIQKWVKSIGFQPVFPKEAFTVCPTKNPLCHRDQEKDYQIDNVLVQGTQKFKGQLIFNQKGEFLSDHYGQLVELSLNPKIVS